MGGSDSMLWIALTIGRGVDDTWSIRDMGASTKRKENQSSSNSGRKRKTSIPRGFQGRGGGNQDQSRVGASSQTGQMTSYQCHQPGHMRWDCPQRQGSHNYGIAQSQSLMGQART